MSSWQVSLDSRSTNSGIITHMDAQVYKRQNERNETRTPHYVCSFIDTVLVEHVKSGGKMRGAASRFLLQADLLRLGYL